MAYPSHKNLTYCSEAFTDPMRPSSLGSQPSISTTSITTSAYHEQQLFEHLYTTSHAELIRKEFGEAAYQLELLRLEAYALNKERAKRARQSKWLSVQIACEAERRSVVKGWMRLKAAAEILYTIRGE